MTESWLIILNWNGREDTLALLDGLSAEDLRGTTVLVVDNDSDDDTLSAVHLNYPWVRTLQTGANLGYAGGNNRGIDLAMSQGARVIGVLNNDTEVTPGFWPPLVEQASQPMTAVSPDIRYADDPRKSWFYGGRLSRRRGTAEHLREAYQPPRTGPTTSEVLSGCCLVASADTWAEVGGFDESLFLIFEDSDWSLRARDRGVSLLLEPRSVIRHKVSRSFIGPGTVLGRFYYHRNGLIFASRHMGINQATRFLASEFRRAIASTLKREPNSARGLLIIALATLASISGQRGPAGETARRVAGFPRPHESTQVTPKQKVTDPH